MPLQSATTRRFGVFATLRGWLVADPDLIQDFDSRSEAVGAARRLAHIARWRGSRAEVLAQDEPGGPLTVIDPRDPD
ncbi:MAG TPA: hypothetical protein VFE13_20545 [Caulobacteraceae bacterium]|jgi:hypothetical protein|nr:hypothetical protein [Caulobacteraceae bacterium]